ncbi:MAG: hypothetical protein QXW20_08410 [Ignisphaera sp.]
MAWTKYFELDQTKIRDMYQKNQRWGDLITYQWISDSQYLYGIGWYQSGSMTVPKWGSTIPVAYASIGDKKCRIDIDALGMFGINSTGTSYVTIAAVKGDKLVSPYIYAVGVAVNSPPNRTIGIPFKVSIIVEGNRMSVYLDNEKTTDADLSDVADGIRVGVLTQNVSGNVGCMFTYISASYYDVIAGMVQQITSILPTIMYLMIGLMFISLIVRMFRRRRVEKRVVEEKEKK